MVHCLAGVSRSVCLVIAYLIQHRGFSYDEAYALIKSKRGIVITKLCRFILMMGLSANYVNLRMKLEEVGHAVFQS
jgi:protein-tyrosine phosphatase